MGFLFGVAILLVGLWHFIPAEKQGRLKTLWNPESGPANALESAEGRLEGLKAGWQMFSENPLTGVGPGGNNFMGYRMAHLDGIRLQAHNLIGELLGELGLLGAIVFIGQIMVIWLMSGKKLRPCVFNEIKGGSDNLFLGSACRQTLLLLLFGGLSGHNLYRINWLWIGGWSFLCFHWRREKLLTGLREDLEKEFNVNYLKDIKP
jgi:hypothetical protein